VILVVAGIVFQAAGIVVPDNSDVFNGGLIIDSHGASRLMLVHPDRSVTQPALILEKDGVGAQLASDAKYDVRLASSDSEIASALRLRHDIFNVELGVHAVSADHPGFEQDVYDPFCRHLIVVERETGRTVGTYRLNSIESVDDIDRLYSFGEFSIEELPIRVLERGLEIGRACIAADHRNSKVLFLLWKALANYLVGKRYFFGCCSIFTRDRVVGERAYKQLVERGHFHETFRVEPRRNALYSAAPDGLKNEPVALPSLFEMYLRIGAKVCGPPMLDDEFGTVDFFVVFDVKEMGERYRRLFFS